MLLGIVHVRLVDEVGSDDFVIVGDVFSEPFNGLEVSSLPGIVVKLRRIGSSSFPLSAQKDISAAAWLLAPPQLLGLHTLPFLCKGFFILAATDTPFLQKLLLLVNLILNPLFLFFYQVSVLVLKRLISQRVRVCWIRIYSVMSVTLSWSDRPCKIWGGLRSMIPIIFIILLHLRRYSPG